MSLTKLKTKIEALNAESSQSYLRTILRTAKKLGLLYGTTDYYMVHDDPAPTIDLDVPSEDFAPVRYWSEGDKPGISFSEEVFKASYSGYFTLQSVSKTEAVFKYSLFCGNKRGRFKIDLFKVTS